MLQLMNGSTTYLDVRVAKFYAAAADSVSEAELLLFCI